MIERHFIHVYGQPGAGKSMRDAAERPRATRLAREFEALPKSLFGSRPRKAWVADLADPRDPGIKSAIATIKRALRAGT